jgi:glycosyltransferase involved in cell wall biosynthesis
MNIIPLPPRPVPSVEQSAAPGVPSAAPPITVITPSLNRARFVEGAIDSVRRQGYPACEHVVVDGGSTDGTCEVVRRYPDVRLITRRDANAHEAMNRGLAAAGGEIIGFLNTDDFYAPGIVSAVARYFTDNAGELVVFGRAFVIRASGDGDREVVGEIAHFTDEEASWAELLYGAPAFNSWFFRKEVFERFGGFDAGLHIAADRAFLIRLALAGMWPAAVLGPCYHYLRHEGSATIDPAGRRAAALLREHLTIADRLLAERPGRDARTRLSAWRAFESLQLVARTRREEGVARAAALAIRALVRDPAWPRRLMRAIETRHRFRRRLADRRGAA